ncbi:MAG: T9SS type A sorting domain-containing protein [Dysgonamonadaceae bacterium]|nr:T9SS type A sorting domain-containing protein [Dysgonamonadaceae bacterium]
MKKVILLLSLFLLTTSGGWVFSQVHNWVDSSLPNAASAGVKDIPSGTDLASFSYSTASNFRLQGDCYASAPIPALTGKTIDFDDYEVTANGPSLFTSLTNCNIKNLLIVAVAANSSTLSYLGPLAQQATNTHFTNCRLKAGLGLTVTNAQVAGGLVGYADGCYFTQCRSDAIVDLSSTTSTIGGGLIGYATGTAIKLSFATGKVTAQKQAGGLVGFMMAGSIVNSYALGDVEQITQTRTISNCSTNGPLGTYNIAADWSYLSAGGLVGTINNSTQISQSYAAGIIKAVGTYVTWESGTMDCHSTCDAWDSFPPYDCNTWSNKYTTAYMTYGGSAGTICGYTNNDALITDCYYSLSRSSTLTQQQSSHPYTVTTGYQHSYGSNLEGARAVVYETANNQGKSAVCSSGVGYGALSAYIGTDEGWTNVEGSTYPMLKSTMVDYNLKHNIPTFTKTSTGAATTRANEVGNHLCARTEYDFDGFASYTPFGAADYFNYGGTLSYNYRLYIRRADGSYTDICFNQTEGKGASAVAGLGYVLPTSGEYTCGTPPTDDVIPNVEFDRYNAYVSVAVFPKYDNDYFNQMGLHHMIGRYGDWCEHYYDWKHLNGGNDWNVYSDSPTLPFSEWGNCWEYIVAGVHPLPTVAWDRYVDVYNYGYGGDDGLIPGVVSYSGIPKLNANTVCYDYRDTTMNNDVGGGDYGWFAGSTPVIEPRTVDTAYVRLTFTGRAPYIFAWEKEESDNGQLFTGDITATVAGGQQLLSTFEPDSAHVGYASAPYGTFPGILPAPTFSEITGKVSWSDYHMDKPHFVNNTNLHKQSNYGGSSFGIMRILPSHVDDPTTPRGGTQPAYSGHNLYWSDFANAPDTTSTTSSATGDTDNLGSKWGIVDYWGCYSNDYTVYYGEAFKPFLDMTQTGGAPLNNVIAFDTVIVNPLPIMQYPYPTYQDASRSFAHMDTVICEGDTVWKKVFYNPNIPDAPHSSTGVDAAFADSMHFQWTWSANAGQSGNFGGWPFETNTLLFYQNPLYTANWPHLNADPIYLQTSGPNAIPPFNVEYAGLNGGDWSYTYPDIEGRGNGPLFDRTYRPHKNGLLDLGRDGMPGAQNYYQSNYTEYDSLRHYYDEYYSGNDFKDGQRTLTRDLVIRRSRLSTYPVVSHPDVFESHFRQTPTPYSPSTDAGVTTFNDDPFILNAIELADTFDTSHSRYAVIGNMNTVDHWSRMDSLPTFKVPTEWRGSITRVVFRVTPLFANYRGGVCFAKKTDFGYEDYQDWRYRGVTDFALTVDPRPFPMFENQYQEVRNGAFSKNIQLDNQIVDYDTLTKLPLTQSGGYSMTNYQPAIDTSWYAWTDQHPEYGMITAYDSIALAAVPPSDPSIPTGGSLHSAWPHPRDFIPGYETYNNTSNAIYDTIKVRPYYINRIVCHGYDTVVVIKINPKEPPRILVQPVGAVICEHDDYVLKVVASGDNLTYQWYKDGTKLIGRFSDTLQIHNASYNDYDKYYVKVSGVNNLYVISDTVQVWVAHPLPATLALEDPITEISPNKTYKLKVAYTDIDVTKYDWSYSNNTAAFDTLQTIGNTSTLTTGSDPMPGTVTVQMTHVCGNRTVTHTITKIVYGTGLDDVSENVKVYPNPVTDILYIEPAQRDAAIDAVTVVDANGRTLLTTQLAPVNYRLSTTGWKSGVYFLRLKSTAGTEVLKVLKN